MLALVLALSLTAAPPPPSARADHLVMLVFDAMRPDYVDRFDLPNFKRLRRMSREYVHAYVGHMGAETVVSHAVLTTGRLPRDLPWQDEVYVDHAAVLGPAGTLYGTGSLSGPDLWKLQRTLPPDTFLAARTRKVHGGRVFSVAQKHYSAYVFGSPTADVVVTMAKADGRCTPTGENVPAYVSGNPRYTVDCAKKYGTEHSFYPLDGAKGVPGDDPAHLGGDVWVGDIAMEILEREADWSVLALSFGGIDKIAHLSGEQDVALPLAFTPAYTLEAVVRVADAQLGRVLDALEKKKLLGRTALVVTADHGGQSNVYYFGTGRSRKVAAKRDSGELVSPWLERLRTLGRAREIVADSAIRVWLEDGASVPRATELLREVSGVVEVYALRQDAAGEYEYTRVHSWLDRQPPAFRAWAAAHNAELVGSMAARGGPDLVALLADNVGFDLLGDHGGAQEKVQRIPMFVAAPGLGRGKVTTPMRLADVEEVVGPVLGWR